jgi:hypothetical protein
MFSKAGCKIKRDTPSFLDEPRRLPVLPRGLLDFGESSGHTPPRVDLGECGRHCRDFAWLDAWLLSKKSIAESTAR